MIRKKDIRVHSEQYKHSTKEHIIRASVTMGTTFCFNAEASSPTTLESAKQDVVQYLISYVYDDVLMKTHDVFQRLMDTIYKLNTDGDYRRMEAVDLAHSELANYIRDILEEKELGHAGTEQGSE